MAQVTRNILDRACQKASADCDQVIELLIPIYDSHFSKEDIKAIIEYNESPTGRKVSATHVEMTKQNSSIVSTWLQKEILELNKQPDSK